MKTFCMGDIHGSYKGMIQCLQQSNFDYNNDKLIFIGDCADGWPQVRECFDELLKIKNLTYVLGNHDIWLLEWVINGRTPLIWLNQGGEATMDSYGGMDKVPTKHIDLISNARYYYEYNNKLFVHGGIDLNIKDIRRQKNYILVWDRHLIETAYKWKWRAMADGKIGSRKFTDYDEIFIGHTTTLSYNTTKPMHCCNVWNLDTGCGWSGVCTIMDINTHKYFQSDFCKDLYPEVKGRE